MSFLNFIIKDRTNKYKTQFNSTERNYLEKFFNKEIKIQDESLNINNVPQNLKDKEDLIIDVFYAIYDKMKTDKIFGKNYKIEDFCNTLKNRLENIRIDCDFPTENGENGAYRDTEKELVIFPNVFNNKFKDYFDKELASNKQMEISNYLLVRTLIHEGLHCISNNDLRHYINDKIELEALDELYTLKLESEIYKEYFEKTFAKGKDLYLKNYQIKEKRKIDLFENGQKETYITTRDLDIHGYGFINKMAHYISFIDKDFTDIGVKNHA